MTWKYTSFFTFCFCFMFVAAFTVHYGHMKTPSQSRGIASFAWAPEKPWYDASWKM